MICYGKGKLQYVLSSKEFAAGGEGKLYDITGQPNLVAKIYKDGKAIGEKEQKLARMVNFPPAKNVLSQIAWPQDVLYNAGQFIGFIMQKMDINEDLNVMYEYGSSAKYPNITWENKIIIAQNICAVLSSIHNSGYVCGDLNPKNISIDPKKGFVVFLDTDSYHVSDGTKTYRCEVGIPEYLPVEIQKKVRGGYTLATTALPTFSQDTDNFALAIHIFQLLMNGAHPFACAILPSHSSVAAPQPSDNIEKGEFPFMQKISGIRIPPYAPKITILPKKMQALFKRAFIDGHKSPSARPKPEEWHIALAELRKNLKICKKVAYHQYNGSLSSCPWCGVTESYNKAFNKVALAQIPIKPPVSMPTKQRAVRLSRSAITKSIIILSIILVTVAIIKFLPNFSIGATNAKAANTETTNTETTNTETTNTETTTYAYKYALETPVNIRAGKGTKYEIIGQMKKDERFEMEDSCKAGWCKARARGIEGYVHISQAKETPTPERAITNGNDKEKANMKGKFFTDTRDGNKYRMFVIGKQTWMAENLSYNAGGSKCYGNSESNCQKYGRLYNWKTAQFACPKGWHLPSKAEWEVLTATGDRSAGKYLKDKSGFAALPGGYGHSDGRFFNAGNNGSWWNAGNNGSWWSASEYNSNYAYYRSMNYGYEYAICSYYGKSALFSVRCLQDSP